MQTWKCILKITFLYIFSNLPLQACVHASLQSLFFVFLNILWLDLVRYSVNNSVTFRAVTKSLFVDLVMHGFEKDLKGFGRSTGFSNVLPCNCYCRFWTRLDVQWLISTGESSLSCGFQAAAGRKLWHFPEFDQKTETIIEENGHWHCEFWDSIFQRASTLNNKAQKHFMINYMSSGL